MPGYVYAASLGCCRYRWRTVDHVAPTGRLVGSQFVWHWDALFRQSVGDALRARTWISTVATTTHHTADNAIHAADNAIQTADIAIHAADSVMLRGTV